MPKEKRTPFQQGYTNWDYNWSQVYMNVYAEAVALHYLFPKDERLTYDEGNIPPKEMMLETTQDYRENPNLLITGSMNKVLCKENPDDFSEEETHEKEQAKVQSLRERFRKFCAAVDEKQIEMAAENPEGASFLRMMRDKASFALRGYGIEAMNDYSFSLIASQEGAIHMPTGKETSPTKGDFTRSMDELSDLPFMPVYENATRMVNIACDHANAVKTGTLTERQDRLSRKLLLTQYDQVSAGVEETLRATGDKNSADFVRWAAVMDNPPSDLGLYERGCFRVPYDMEGRRIALRQGWPVEDASMLGYLFVLQSRITNPLPGKEEKYSPSVQASLAALIQEISSTRITSPETRTTKLNRIFDYLAQNQKELHLDRASVASFTDLWKTFEIQPCQYLSEQELNEAAQEYTRRSALPHVAGSDGSPVGYFEQALAGTEVLSRLSAMREVMSPANKERRDLPEYTRLREATESLVERISGLYGPVPPKGANRTKLMENLSADHMKLNELATAYLAKCSKSEPAFKKEAAQELQRFCYSCAQTAIYTDIGKGMASFRRSSLDWVIEKKKAKGAPSLVQERYDVTAQKPEVIGTLANQRYAFRLPQKDGQVKEGFFTADLALPTMDEAMEALNERIARISPVAAKAIRVMEEKSASFKRLSNDELFTVPTKQQQNQEKYIHTWEYSHCYDDYLREAGFPEKEIKTMATGVFAEAIDEYLTTKLQITGRQDQYETINVNPGETVALRNAAMSTVADALGIGSLLAASRPVTLVRHGREVDGVFMERGTGSDCMNPKEDDPILKMTANTAFSPKVQRELASLQVLDYICGNVDRHPGNLLYSFTKDSQGNVVLDGVQGIDNDMSFMGCKPDRLTTVYADTTRNLNHMPQSLADKVMQLKPEALKSALRAFRLPEQQIERAAERLTDVQNQITSGREYFRDKELDAVSEDHIHVVPDEDYAKLSPQTQLADAVRTEVPKLSQMSLLEHDRVKVRNNFRKDEQTLLSLYQRADESDKAVWFGSKEFENMKKALRTYGQQYSAMLEPNEQDRQAGRKLHSPTREEMEELRVSFNKLGGAARDYLIRKQDEMDRKGSLDKMSQARVRIAREVQEMLDRQAEHINELLGAQQREAKRAAEAQRQATILEEKKTAMLRLKQSIESEEKAAKALAEQQDRENAERALQNVPQFENVLNNLLPKKQAAAVAKVKENMLSQEKAVSDAWQETMFTNNRVGQYNYMEKAKKALSNGQRAAASVYVNALEDWNTSMGTYNDSIRLGEQQYRQNNPGIDVKSTTIGYKSRDMKAYDKAGYNACVAFACTKLFKPNEPVDQMKLDKLVEELGDNLDLKRAIQQSVIKDKKSYTIKFDQNSDFFRKAQDLYDKTIRNDLVRAAEKQHAAPLKLNVDDVRNAMGDEFLAAKERYDAEMKQYKEAEQARLLECRTKQQRAIESLAGQINGPQQKGGNPAQPEPVPYRQQPLPEAMHNARSLLIHAAVANHLLEMQYPDRNVEPDLKKLKADTENVIRDSRFMEKAADPELNKGMLEAIQKGCETYLDKQKSAEQKQIAGPKKQANSKKKNNKPGLKA